MWTTILLWIDRLTAHRIGWLCALTWDRQLEADADKFDEWLRHLDEELFLEED